MLPCVVEAGYCDEVDPSRRIITRQLEVQECGSVLEVVKT